MSKRRDTEFVFFIITRHDPACVGRNSMTFDNRAIRKASLPVPSCHPKISSAINFSSEHSILSVCDLQIKLHELQILFLWSKIDHCYLDKQNKSPELNTIVVCIYYCIRKKSSCSPNRLLVSSSGPACVRR